jgi:[ribosomal protein S18]-alanine N-acetyltransferase
MSAVVRPQPMPEPMHADHLEVVHAIEQIAYEFPWTLGVFTDCLKVGYSCWVLDDPDAGGIVGYGILSLGAGEAHVLNLCVHPELHRRGLGRLMLRHLLEVAEDYGATEIFLEVRPTNREALAMYLACGFNEVGLRHGYYPSAKGREDAMVLARRL